MDQKNQREGKPKFNKKKWRETQFSHEVKVAEWKSKREFAVKKRFNKMMVKDKSLASSFDVNEIYSQEEKLLGENEATEPSEATSVNNETLIVEPTILPEKVIKATPETSTQEKNARALKRLESQNPTSKKFASRKNDSTAVRANEPKPRLTHFQRAQLAGEKVKQEREKLRQEKIQKAKEREEAIKKNKEVRLERIKKLTQKTKKGQPVMKGRIEILLEKIQKQVASDKPV